MLFIIAVCLFFAVAVTAAVIYFFFKYERKTVDEIGVPIHGDMRLETAWIVVPLILSMVMFAWGAVVYVNYRRRRRTPGHLRGRQAVDVEAAAAQRPKEINELHVPVGRNIKLIMASEDVIHDFYVPAFRVKMDVVPGHYNTMWFRPTKIGQLSFLLLAVLRHQPRADGRLGHRDGSGGLCGVACPDKAADRESGRSRRKTVHGTSLHHVPSRRWHRARTFAEWRVWRESCCWPTARRLRRMTAYLRESILAAQRKNRGRISASDAHVPGTIDRGADLSLTAYIKSLQSQPRTRDRGGSCAGHREEISMSTKPLTTAQPSYRAKHYLNCHLRHPFVAADHRPQAHRAALSCFRHVLLLHRRHFRHHDPHSLADARGLSGSAGYIQQAVHHARRGHDFLFPDSVDSRGAGKFPDSA